MRPNHPRATILAFAAAAGALFVGSCAPTVVPPPPRPAPAPAPAPAPVPRTPPPASWRDAPATPGDWVWGIEGGRSLARFAGGALVLRCDRPGGTVTLLRAGVAQGAVPMTILTTTITRPLSGTPDPGPPPAIAVRFAANDPLLDAMAFSRGRFAVEVSGLPTLYVPSWPEVGRVIQDCR